VETSIIPERNGLAVSVVKLASRTFLSPFFKTNIRGIENIPEKESFVLLPKHQRWEDIPLIAISIERPLYFVAKQELFNNFLSKRVIAMLGGLPLDREKPNRSRFTFSAVLHKLKHKEGVVIFPEGTYYKNCMGSGRTGFIRMIYSNVRTVFLPAGIKYSDAPGRKSVDITFGIPVGNDKFSNPKELLDYAMNEIAGLSGLR